MPSARNIAHEHLLRDLLGVDGADDAVRHAEHAALVLVVEHLHRAGFAAPAGRDQLGVIGERGGHARAGLGEDGCGQGRCGFGEITHEVPGGSVRGAVGHRRIGGRTIALGRSLPGADRRHVGAHPSTQNA